MSQIFISKSYKQSAKIQNTAYANNSINLADILEPTNGYDVMDVIKKFNWTLSPLNDTITKEVPYIKLTEYYLVDSYLNQLFKTYGSTAQTGIDVGKAFLNPFTLQGNDTRLYQGMYDHDYPTGFIYTFPYFSQDYLNTSNSWTAKPMFQEIVNLQKKVEGYSAAIGGGLAGGLLGWLLSFVGITGSATDAAIASAKAAKAGAEQIFELKKFTEVAEIGLESPVANLQDPAIDKPHIWSTTTPRSFNITFPLYNTITQPKGKLWYTNILKNWELCYLLSYQNLFNKRNLFTGIPPVFYEIDIPGVHYSKAGYISNLQILNSGNIRKYALPIQASNILRDVNVPDAYIINMTVTDFFIPSKNFMSSLCIKDKNNLPINEPFQGGRELGADQNVNPADLPPGTVPSPFGGTQPGVAPGLPPSYYPCWVAREVYGATSIKWVIFRDWLYGNDGPTWLQKIYTKYGKQFAAFISNKPIIKRFIKSLMNIVVNKHI